MGMFDDLIPQGQPQNIAPPPSGGMFDDLIPKAAQPTTAGKAQAPGGVEPWFDYSDLAEPIDAASGLGKGMAEGVIGAPGIAGDVVNLVGAGNDYLRKKGVPIPKVLDKNLPGSQDIINAAKPYVPALQETHDTDAGRYGEEIGKLIPLSGGGVKNAIRYAVVPGAVIKKTEDYVKSGALPEWAPAVAGTVAALGASIPGHMPTKPPPAAYQPSELVQAAERQGIPLPVGAVSDNIAARQGGKIVKDMPVVGAPLVQASHDTIEALKNKVGAAAQTLGSNTPANAAGRAGETLQGLADAEQAANAAKAQQATEAAQAAAQAQDEMAQGVAQQALESGKASILNPVEQQAQQAAQAAEQAFPAVTPNEMGETLTQAVKSANDAAKAGVGKAFDELGATDATISARGIANAHDHISNALDAADKPIIVDDQLTPFASKMMQQIEQFSNFGRDLGGQADLDLTGALAGKPIERGPGGKIANMTPEEIRAAAATGKTTLNQTPEAVPFQAIAHMRKRLVALQGDAMASSLPGKISPDQRAASGVMRAFDNWLQDATDNYLYSGSPDALEKLQAANKANRDWLKTFGFDAKTDAERQLNKIATGEVTPEETANWIIGAGKIGAKGSAARLIDRLPAALGDNSEAMQQVKSAVWNRLTQTPAGVSDKAAPKIADAIGDFLNGSGQSVATRLFSPEERGIMKLYADTHRQLDQTQKAVASGAKLVKTETTKVPAVKPDVGPMEELAKTVLGNGGKRDEAIFNAIEAYSKEKGGDAQTLSKLLRILPQEQKDGIASAMLERMGRPPSGNAQDFSPAVWLTNWNKMSHPAKTLLFGNAGTLRQSLDDIAKISDRMKRLEEFANPSGSGRTILGGLGLSKALGAGGALLHGNPMPAIYFAGETLGMRKLAQALAEPATVASMAKWARRYEKLVTMPSRLKQAPADAMRTALDQSRQNLIATVGNKIPVAAPRPGGDKSSDAGDLKRPATLAEKRARFASR